MIEMQRLPKDEKYIAIISDLISSEVVLKMDNYIQHGTTTTLEHCINVSYSSYKYCEKHGLDSISAARAGLLHDMFLYDWHDKSRGIKRYYHGFTHGFNAFKNAKEYFVLNKIEEDAIKNHMWPLTLLPPRTKVGYVVQWCDKKCGIMETRGIDILEDENENHNSHR